MTIIPSPGPASEPAVISPFKEVTPTASRRVTCEQIITELHDSRGLGPEQEAFDPPIRINIFQNSAVGSHLPEVERRDLVRMLWGGAVGFVIDDPHRVGRDQESA